MPQWFPTVGFVSRTADTIVLARVTSPNGNDPVVEPPVDLDVVRVIRGSAPATMRVERPLLTGCGDGLGLLKARQGSRLVIAFGVDVRFGDRTTPAWVEQRKGQWHGISERYSDLRSLLLALKTLPDTSGVQDGSGPAPSPYAAFAAFAAIALAASAFASRWRRRARLSG